ncbi:hypothetical protein KUTeg_016452 [Tegillarca granosa]|uniref:Uncharacterized protein n=1 Tax=Tegillarca granosa TaxID=220873 RepID=A0ABQ9EQN6_TEGGR|nr:hypothetical protein KUTeg_016452 [Tegillarca granosa]
MIMGAPLTKQRGVCVQGKNETRKYVPLTPYKPFPEERRKAPGELISQFPAFPAAPETVLSDGELYWLADCDFMPYNDSTIFTSSGAYQPRLNHPWIPDKRVPVGRLCRLHFDRPKLREYHNKGKKGKGKEKEK